MTQAMIPAGTTYRLPGDPNVWAYVSETGRLVVMLPGGTWVYLYPQEEPWKQSNSPSS